MVGKLNENKDTQLASTPDQAAKFNKQQTNYIQRLNTNVRNSSASRKKEGDSGSRLKEQVIEEEERGSSGSD